MFSLLMDGAVGTFVICASQSSVIVDRVKRATNKFAKPDDHEELLIFEEQDMLYNCDLL